MPRIDTALIPGYEEMSAEEKVKAMEAFEYDDNTQTVDRLKNSVSKANSEAAEWKRKHKELLSEDDRKRTEQEEYIESMKNQLEALQKEKSQQEFKSKFLAQGYTEELATKAAIALCDHDFDTMFSCQSDFVAARDKALKAEWLKDVPKPPAPSPEASTMTKAQFMKLSPTERYNFSKEHPEEYSAFYKP